MAEAESPPKVVGDKVRRSSPRTPRLLIVDDSIDNREVLVRAFRRAGYETIQAEGGREALELIETEPLDLVLLDVRMPDMDGREVLRTIRSRYPPVAMPVILVTGNAASKDVVEGLKLGANDYITKPVDFAIARARVETQIGRKRAEERLWQANQDLERKVAERTADFEAATAAAQSANRAKDDFLANMSHELRTPLNGVLAVAELLVRELNDGRTREYAELIAASSRVLERVVSDILDFSRIEAGRMHLSAEAFDIGPLVARVADLHGASAEAKGLALRWSVADRANGVFLGDPVRLTQVVSNLLSNAVKFTHTGEIELSVDRPAEELLLTVRDTGIGFDEGVGERLFRPFEQADASITRRFGGTGLGLAICDSMVKMMGGRIEARSSPGCGSEFRVYIPLQPAEMAAGAEQGADADEDSLPSLRVLLAEDHAINQRVIELILTSSGHQLVVVENGRHAVETYSAEPFDLVLMDMQMPEMDGLSATQEIRRREAELGCAPTPIIMLTAHALADHRAASRAAGADGHITKPVQPSELLKAMGSLVRAKRRTAA